MNGLKTSASWMLILLFLVNVMSYLDRQVLAIVQESIKEDFGWNDAHLGWLQLIFGIALALSAIPIGRLADRISRQKVLVACLSLWSAATVFAGVAASFTQMLIARLGVGIGEAGVTPTAYALISDKFSIRRRATAMAVCGAGVPVGIALSLILGGIISEQFGWRWAFIMFGLPGFFLAGIIAFLLTPPRRGESDGIAEVRETTLTQSIFRLFSSSSFSLVIVGTACMTISSAGIMNWMPSFMQRRFGLDEATVGVSIGSIVGICALVSMLAAAFLADKLSERDQRWYPWIVAIAQLLALPCVLLALFSPTYTASLLFFALSALFSSSLLAISNALIQNTAPVHMRSMASALKSMALTFIGFGVGSFMIGQLSEHVFNTGSEATDLLWALVVGASFHVLAALAFWTSAFSVRQDIAKARTDSAIA